MTVDRVEKVFTVAVPVERAWAAFADSAERAQWEAASYQIDARPGGEVRWSLPGIEAVGEVIEAEPHRVLRHTESTGPHSGSEITVRFEAEDGATRITITHAGFGAGEGWDEWLEGTSTGWSQAIADLIVYLETGVPARRFTTEMQFPGMTLTNAPAGAVVESVTASGLAAEVGLAPGDIVLRIDDVPVFSISDVWVLMRERDGGAHCTVEFVHDGERRTGAGFLSTWPVPV